jgi:peptidoglycan/xylan/chitin deacetylase (PgdA/CDA1 family)
VRGPVTAYRSGPDRLVAALSFDDGPSIDTAAFVAMLKANRVPGTFFEIGDQIAPAYFKTMRTMLRDGDAIGDHTFTHPKLVDSDDVATQLAATITAIRSATGYTPCVFRPPYGLYNASIEATARALGLATIMWNVDPSDYLQPGVQVIEQRVLEEVQPGSIIISHDGGGPRAQTLAAYPYIIAALRKRGYHFETVPRLLGFHTIYRRCTTRCRGEGVRAPPPKGSIVEPPD